MEIWRDIVGYEGLYQISNNGNVRSFHSKDGSPLLLTHEVIKKGYCRVCLYKNGVKKKELIHRLVAFAFVPNPCNLPFVNHKDEDKSNNHSSNLEWCTNIYNENYGTRNKRTGESRQKPIIVHDRLNNYALVAEYPSLKHAGKAYGVCADQIAYYCRTTRSPRKELLRRYKFSFKNKKDHFSRQQK